MYSFLFRHVFNISSYWRGLSQVGSSALLATGPNSMAVFRSFWRLLGTLNLVTANLQSQIVVNRNHFVGHSFACLSTLSMSLSVSGSRLAHWKVQVQACSELSDCTGKLDLGGNLAIFLAYKTIPLLVEIIGFDEDRSRNWKGRHGVCFCNISGYTQRKHFSS